MKEYQSNMDKVLHAVLLDEDLMEFGKYSPQDIKSIYQLLDSENLVLATVAKIIFLDSNESATENEIYKQISAFLKQNV